MYITLRNIILFIFKTFLIILRRSKPNEEKPKTWFYLFTSMNKLLLRKEKNIITRTSAALSSHQLNHFVPDTVLQKNFIVKIK